MGQRANYILIEGDQQTIYYNHWRANTIAADLYLGDKRFIEFVKECEVVTVFLDEVWIEGCVIIDMPKKAIYFWSCEFAQTSVVEIYLIELQNKWLGWSVSLLFNKMYDVERLLNIDYISKQERQEFTAYTVAEIEDDVVEEWSTATVILKTSSRTYIIKTGNLNIGGILNFGESIIDILLAKPTCDLPLEEDDNVYGCVVVDTVNKQITIDSSEFDLWEQTHQKWNGYKFEMGDYGYIETLRRAKIDTSKISMSATKATEAFYEMIKQRADFDPFKMADLLLKEEKNIKFSPGFFDNLKPKKTLFEKIGSVFNEIMANKNH